MGNRSWRASWRVVCGLTLVVAATVARPEVASACGCFANPDPSVPVVQAGERILFSVKNGEVTAHIQIQYQGDAKDFGWLLPLPSVPTLELGVDEVFTQLTARTQPSYRLNTVFDKSCDFNLQPPSPGGNGSASDLGVFFGSPDMGMAGGGPSPLVIQDRIGPYDYAVLKADDKMAMLDWLKNNRYFVPDGTDTAVVPYIHPGAFFLALKLQSGQAAGDLQPVVVRYASDLAMIPIVLTSVGAVPDMGIQVWMVGNGRAIPRNYHHTLINDAQIDWGSGGRNYNDVIIRATREAPGRHTFVTEYAGSSDVMKDVLDSPGRFGKPEVLRTIKNPTEYVGTLSSYNFPQNSVVLGILRKYIPIPDSLKDRAATYYYNLPYYLGIYKMQHPDEFAGLDFTLDAVALTDELWKRVVTPTQAASKLLTDYPNLTRLYTTLSPAEMNSDPVFSFNPSLPSVSNVHTATLTIFCVTQMMFPRYDHGRLVTAQGFAIDTDTRAVPKDPKMMPYSLRVETLREDGAGEVLTDNLKSIRDALGLSDASSASGASCSVQQRPIGSDGRSVAGWIALALAGVTLVVRRARRRR